MERLNKSNAGPEAKMWGKSYSYQTLVNLMLQWGWSFVYRHPSLYQFNWQLFLKQTVLFSLYMMTHIWWCVISAATHNQLLTSTRRMITQNSVMCLLLFLHVISPSLPAQVCHPLLYSSQVLQCKQTEFASLISGGFLITRLLQEDWQVRIIILS